MSDSNEHTEKVDSLVARLRAHAEAHEYIANADEEQKQWMCDLYDSADEIVRMRAALDAIVQYGADSLDGRDDGPDDRAWYKGTVLAITKRARIGLAR